MFITFPAIAIRAVTVGAEVRLFRLHVDLAYVHALSRGIAGFSSSHVEGVEQDGSHASMSEDLVAVGTTVRF